MLTLNVPSLLLILDFILLYRCLDLLLPKLCHLDEPPAGKCCKVPVCPANYPYNYPPGYILV